MVALASTSPNAGSALHIAGLSHDYRLKDGSLPVLDNVDLRIAPGEFVALLGPSGCGKSTLLRLVAGLEKPAQGTVFADDLPVEGPHPSRVVVFQDPTLFPWRNVRENVALGLEAQGLLHRHSARIDDVLRTVGLADFSKAFPHQLSGGMAQRAALARALVNDPSVLILDEPLGRLDSLTRMTMQGEITKLWQASGFSVLLVTHDIEEALLLATRVIVFSERPARVKADISIERPYPRHRDDSVLVGLRREILSLLGLSETW